MHPIIPVAETSIDWPNYLKAGKAALGRNLSQQLDNHKLAVGDAASFLVTLGNLVNPDTVPSKILSDPGPILAHYSFSFVTVLDSRILIELLESASLHIRSVELNVRNLYFVFLSGTLAEWKESIHACCSIDTSIELRAMFDYFLLHFEKKGLQNLWVTHMKKILPDSTFILTAK